jgi:hypothetical protein
MTTSEPKDPPKPSPRPNPRELRDQRRAQALRDNLRRRKGPKTPAPAREDED